VSESGSGIEDVNDTSITYKTTAIHRIIKGLATDLLGHLIPSPNVDAIRDIVAQNARIVRRIIIIIIHHNVRRKVAENVPANSSSLVAVTLPRPPTRDNPLLGHLDQRVTLILNPTAARIVVHRVPQRLQSAIAARARLLVGHSRRSPDGAAARDVGRGIREKPYFHRPIALDHHTL
jgi:hypothetical protein